MAGIILPGQFTSQPQYEAAPDRQSPFLSAMAAEVLVVPRSSFRDSMRGSFATVTGTPLRSVGDLKSAGPARSMGFPDAGTSGQFQFTGRTSGAASGNTWAGVIIRRGLPGGGNNFGYYGIFSNSLNVGFSVSTGFNNGTVLRPAYDANLVGADTTLALNVPYFIIVSMEAKGASSAWYIKVKNLQTTAMVSNQSGSQTINAAGTGTWNIGANVVFGGAIAADIFLLAMGSRYLPPRLADAWCQNPWQIFQAPDRPSMFSHTAAAPSGYKPYWSSQRPRVYGAGVR